MNEPPLFEGIVAFVVVLAPVGFILSSVLRRRLSRLNGAFALVLWGLFIAIVEHVGFGRSEFGGSNLLTHDRFHHQMLAAYGLAALALAGLIIAPLIRRGHEMGWFGLFVLFAIGVTAEILTAMLTTPHGVAPRWWSWGLALWVYPIAWATALILAWRPVFQAAVEAD